MSLSHSNEQTTSAGALAANPSGKRKWSDGEKQLFEQGFKLYGRNWTAIAATMPSRTAVQVKGYAHGLSRQEKEDATEKNIGPWNIDEKQLFEQGFKLHGHNWTAIAATMPGRTARQVKGYAQGLSRKEKEDATKKNIGPWNIDEEQVFVQGLKLHGRNWTAIAATMPGRTARQVSNHGEKCLGKYGPEDYAYLVGIQARAKQILASNVIKQSSDDYLDPIVQMKYAQVFRENPPSKEGSGAAAAKTMHEWFATEYKNDNQDDDNMVIVPV